MENLYDYAPGEPVKVPGQPEPKIGRFIARNNEGVLVRFDVGQPTCSDAYFEEAKVSPLFRPGDIVEVFPSNGQFSKDPGFKMEQGQLLGVAKMGIYEVGLLGHRETIAVSFDTVMYSAVPVLRTLHPELERLFVLAIQDQAKADKATVDYPESKWPEREMQQYVLGLVAGKVDILARALHCVGYSPEAITALRRIASRES